MLNFYIYIPHTNLNDIVLICTWQQLNKRIFSGGSHLSVNFNNFYIKAPVDNDTINNFDGHQIGIAYFAEWINWIK